jgi:hypothetical protein
MSISANQVDNVIKAYSRQKRTRAAADGSPGSSSGAPGDTVTLSGNVCKDDFYRKVSYTLLDLIKK